MATVIHRTTLQVVYSANTPEHPEPTWKHSPDLSLVAGVPFRYWKAPVDWDVSGPIEMTQQEKDAVDSAILFSSRESIVERLNDQEDVLRAFMLTVLDEFNLHALKINAVLDAVDTATSLANLKTLVAAITDYPQRTSSQLRDAIHGKLGS